MGDRTFSGEDVIRIYEEFLTFEEQETVDFFFAVEVEEVEVFDPSELFDGLRALLGLIVQARSVLGGLFGILLRFAPFGLTLLTVVMFAVSQANIVVNQLLSLEEVDA